jgi:hypothetical protein
MKFATVSKSLVMGLALLLASSAFAATRASLQLNDSVNVNGTKLKAGDYSLQWEGSGPNVELSIMRNNKVVAKVPAHVVELEAPASNTAALTQKSGSGDSILAGIQFQGKRFSLAFGDGSDGMMAGSSK